MAVAMDLGNKSAIYGSIHPPDKQDVGFRLALAGRAVAYDDLDVYFSGPIVSDVTFSWQICLLYTSPSPRDLSTSRMPSSA